MSNQTFGLSTQVIEYLRQHSVYEVEAQQQLRALTLTLPGAVMQISPEQGQLLSWLIRLTSAKQVLEIGTYTGYSALTMALALPAEGRILTCEIDPRMPNLGLPYWQSAGVANKIELRIAPALETLSSLAASGFHCDFAFIDADKVNYLAYYQAILPMLVPNGIIAVDNVLWSGAVVDATIQDKQTQAIRAVNDFIYNDSRVDACMLPIGDGLTLARKR